MQHLYQTPMPVLLHNSMNELSRMELQALQRQLRFQAVTFHSLEAMEELEEVTQLLEDRSY